MGNRFLKAGCYPAVLILANLCLCVGCSTDAPAPQEKLENQAASETPEAFFNRALKKEAVKMNSGPQLEEEREEVLLWPLYKNKRVSRGYRVKGRRPHVGLDIPAPTGTEIIAVASGRVIYSGQAFRGYGKMILIDHFNSAASLYGHCSKIFVRTGEKVKKGQVIGHVGRTGRASAPHLHFEIRVNRVPVDPLHFYNSSP